jgi:hypothetical protein
LKTTPESLPFKSALTAVVLAGVNSYQTVCTWKLQIWGSPGSVVVPLRSPLSVNGNAEMKVALAKLSFVGGDENAVVGPAKARSAKTVATSKERSNPGVRMVLSSSDTVVAGHEASVDGPDGDASSGTVDVLLVGDGGPRTRVPSRFGAWHRPSVEAGGCRMPEPPGKREAKSEGVVPS